MVCYELSRFELSCYEMSCYELSCYDLSFMNCRFLVVVFQNVPWEMSFTNLTVGVVVYEMSRYDLS